MFKVKEKNGRRKKFKSIQAIPQVMLSLSLNYLSENILFKIYNTKNKYLQNCVFNHVKRYNDIDSVIVEWDCIDKRFGDVFSKIIFDRYPESITHLIIKGRAMRINQYKSKKKEIAFVRTLKRCSQARVLTFQDSIQEIFVADTLGKINILPRITNNILNKNDGGQLDDFDLRKKWNLVNKDQELYFDEISKQLFKACITLDTIKFINAKGEPYSRGRNFKEKSSVWEARNVPVNINLQ